MPVLKIIKDDFYWDDSLSERCYRLIAEEKNGYRSFAFLIPFVDIKFWYRKIFCGAKKFQFIPNEDTCLDYRAKFGNYFSNAYEVGIMNPNQKLAEKIEQFNKAKSINLLLERHQKPLLTVPSFMIAELIDNSELVFIQEYYFGENGCSVFFFESAFIDTKKYIQGYFKIEYSLDVIDYTNMSNDNK